MCGSAMNLSVSLMLLGLLYLPYSTVGYHQSKRKFRQTNVTADSCQIPEAFQGVWHSDQRDPISISKTEFSGKGTCIGAESPYFLFQFTIGQKTCWRCVSFFQYHYNIVAFKETKCRSQLPSDHKCRMEMFEGDAAMVTLFRAEANPQICPLQGTYKFHYSDYRGSCKSRSSVGHSCAQSSQLQHQYEACPEALQSESKTEILNCIGSWTTNNRRYFAARMTTTPLSVSTEFRCFVYQFDSHKGLIGQSEDASCRDLSDIQAAPIRINLTFDNPPHRHACFFQRKLAENLKSHEKHQWESLQTDFLHTFNGDVWITSNKENQNVSVRQCVSHSDKNPHQMEYITYTSDKCTYGYQCVRIYYRSHQIVELKIGRLTSVFNEACQLENFFDETAPFETLLATDSQLKSCPNHHRFKIHTCDQDDSTLNFNCDSQNHFVLNYKCNKKHQGTHNCLGHWKEFHQEFLILRDVNTHKKSCFVYSRHNQPLLLSGSHGDNCRPGVIPGVNSHIVFNATESEVCLPTSSAFSISQSSVLQRILAICVASVLLQLTAVWPY